MLQLHLQRNCPRLSWSLSSPSLSCCYGGIVAQTTTFLMIQTFHIPDVLDHYVLDVLECHPVHTEVMWSSLEWNLAISLPCLSE